MTLMQDVPFLIGYPVSGTEYAGFLWHKKFRNVLCAILPQVIMRPAP
jgi:hypothetical protein